MDFHNLARRAAPRLQQILREDDRRFVHLALEMGLLTQTRLSEALESRRSDGDRPIADSLVKSGALSGEQAALVEELLHGGIDPDRKWGPYILVNQVDEGGMYVVWKAWDEKMRRWVALKVLKNTDRRQVARLDQEVHALARLTHPSVAQVYEFGRHGENRFIAMEFIDGYRLDLAGLSKWEAAEALCDAASAVQFAHDHGILHRDLKPQNMMRTADGRVFVLDFGLAREIDAEATLGTRDAILGTPVYMAPEQAEGRNTEVTTRTDVYALGATLYHLLTGRPPFSGGSVGEILAQVARTEPVRPRRLRPDIPSDLETIIIKAMEKDPARRYDGAGTFGSDLQRFQAGEPIRARPASAFYRFRKRVQRNPLAAGAIAIAVLSLVGGGVWGYWGLLAKNKGLEREARLARAMELVWRARALVATASTMSYNREAEPEFGQKPLQEAMAALNEAVRMAPEEALPYYWRGRLKVDRMRYAEAEEDLSHAIKLDPTFAPAYAERGRLYMERFAVGGLYHVVELDTYAHEQREELLVHARSDLERAVAGGGWQFEPRLALAQALLAGATGRAAEAEQLLEEGFNRYRSEEFLGWLAIVKIDQGRWAEAHAHLDRALAIRPHSARLLMHRAQALMRQSTSQGDISKMKEAIETLDNAIRANPSGGRLYLMRAIAHAMTRGKLEDAIGDAGSVIELGSESEKTEAYFLRGALHLRLQHDDLAIQDLTGAIRRNGKVPRFWRHRGTAYAGQQRFEEAARDFERAIGLDPSSASGWSNLGLARIKLGKPGQGVKDIDEAIRLDGKYATAYGNRGYGWLDLGEPQKALDDFSKAVELDSTQASSVSLGRERARKMLGETDF